jgi:hypothetical protein
VFDVEEEEVLHATLEVVEGPHVALLASELIVAHQGRCYHLHLSPWCGTSTHPCASLQMRYPCRSHLRNQFLQHFGRDLLEGHLLDAKVVLVLEEEEEAGDALLVNLDCLLEMMTCDDSVNSVADHRSCRSRSYASRVAQ